MAESYPAKTGLAGPLATALLANHLYFSFAIASQNFLTVFATFCEHFLVSWSVEGAVVIDQIKNSK